MEWLRLLGARLRASAAASARTLAAIVAEQFAGATGSLAGNC